MNYPIAKENSDVLRIAQQLSIDRLSLHHFRNYPILELDAAGRNVVLTGRNGAGKTNILEALSLLVPGRGLRKARLSEIDALSYGQPWIVSARVNGMQGECMLGTGRETLMAEKRQVKIDGEAMRSQTELGRHLSMLWLTPQMEQLFNQGTSEGRRFLDRLVYSFDTHHATRINKYDYAMRERNRLLQQGITDPHWLSTLEETMAEIGVAIAQARLDTLASLNHAISLSELSFPKAHIDVKGAVESLLQEGFSALDAENNFRDMLAKGRRRDAPAGRSLEGIHRSVMHVVHFDKNMPAEACSTGEQKALLLSILLAQTRAAALWKQMIPILLLDDVVSHLDGTRKLELFEEICQIGAQVWMTGTDEKFFAELDKNVLFCNVENNEITYGKK